MTRYNTNLAAEFYVLSMLHRLGADAALTLGNKKAVDILVANENKTISTVDVKGLAKAYDWPADNIHQFEDTRHFYALVSFEGKITDPRFPPSAWIIPSKKLTPFIKRYETRIVVSRAKVIANGQKYLHNWSLITEG
ncbi:MAG: hypothetical protein C3F07_18730 [Anaerolineales bacterium]|nr:MAG: hypothetical protein C3F07_18730 [Anaerolineales bacterium]